MNVLLIGCGSVGLGLAASLFDSGVKPDLIARGNTKHAIEQNGIARTGIFRDVKIPADRIRVMESPAAAAGTRYEYIVVSSKATGDADIAAQLASCNSLLSPGGCIVLFQNGFGNERPYFACTDKKNIFTASFAIGFQRPQPYISEVTVITNPAMIGSLFGGDPRRAEPLAKAISDGGIPCGTTEEIEKTIWSKLLYNCSLNPLSAILRVNYGGLVKCGESIQIIRRIIEEIFAVMQAAGYHTFWKDAQTYQKDFFANILPPTYGHRSSTLQDMERKRETEIDSLNGAVVRLGDEYGVPTPCNKMIYQLIKSLESLY